MIDRTEVCAVGMNMQVRSILTQEKCVRCSAATLQGKTAMVCVALLAEHLQLPGVRANLWLLVNDRNLHRRQRYVDYASFYSRTRSF